MGHGLVAVCVPSFGDWKSAMATSMASMCMYSVTHGISVALINQSSSQVASGRNALVRRALELKADWVLFVDSDMAFPPTTLAQLLSSGKDVVGVLCHKKAPPFDQVGSLLDERKGAVARAEYLGTGILLCRSELFRRLPAPWFVHRWGDAAAASASNLDGEVSEDIGFMRQLRAAGVDIWADLELSPKIGHIGELVVTSDTIAAGGPQFKDIGQMAGYRRMK